MLGVLSAEGAIFFALQTIRSIFLILDRVVIPLLAFFASECDFYSCACSHLFGTSYFIYPFSVNGHCLPVLSRQSLWAKKRTKRNLSADR